ncbi:MAG: hypothetical protein AAB649_04895, partial [Patescibacteria group bacterium]
KLACLCGPGILPPESSFWEKIFDSLLVSVIGSGTYTYRFTQKPERTVDDYPSMNFFIAKKLFNKVGGFNNDYWPGEDSKLCNDIVYTLKQHIYYSPRIVVYHHRRDDLLRYLRQHGNYGYHRGAFAAVGDKNSLKISYMIPSLFLIYCLTLPFMSAVTPLYTIPALLYSAVAGILALQTLVAKKNILIAMSVPIVLFLTHITYGAAFIKGIVVGLTKKGTIYRV